MADIVPWLRDRVDEIRRSNAQPVSGREYHLLVAIIALAVRSESPPRQVTTITHREGAPMARRFLEAPQLEDPPPLETVRPFSST
jgi:hypothetical protein